MKCNLIIIFLLVTKIISAQIPVDTYRSEVEKLKTDEDIYLYFKKLQDIDQEVLMKLKDVKTSDSLSIDNMVRTALLFDKFGQKVYGPNNIVPVLNFIHNYDGRSNLAFWSIIKKCASAGGEIDSVGGGYPKYQLEGVSLTFYDYSLLNQDAKYPQLVNKLDALTNNNVIENLLIAFNKTKERQQLKEVKTLGEWNRKAFKNLQQKTKFSFVLMSDNAIYLKREDGIQKLLLVKKTKSSKIYRLENEPFGWVYEYSNNGDLCLYNDARNKLIEYSEFVNKVYKL